MNKTLIAVAIATLGLFATSAFAANADCEAKASAKKLAGAAKTSFVKKCEKDAASGAGSATCEAKAVDKNGKPLAGAAKTSSMKKCEKDMAAAAKK